MTSNLQHMRRRWAYRLADGGFLALAVAMFAGAGICAAGVLHATELAPAMAFSAGFVGFGMAGIGFFIRGGG